MTPYDPRNIRYGWFWEDDEPRLPHANHIVINDDDGDEICIIVVRHEALTDKAIADAEAEASRICRALHLFDVVDATSRNWQ